MDFENFNFDDILGDFVSGTENSMGPGGKPAEEKKAFAESEKESEKISDASDAIDNALAGLGEEPVKPEEEPSEEPEEIPEAAGDEEPSEEAAEPEDESELSLPSSEDWEADLENSDLPDEFISAIKENRDAPPPRTHSRYKERLAREAAEEKAREEARIAEEKKKEAERLAREKVREENRKAREEERKAREEERKLRDAEREAERRRKLREKKADQRMIAEQRQAAEREAREIREAREEARREKKKKDVEGRRKNKIGTVVFIGVIAFLIAVVILASNVVAKSEKSFNNLYIDTIPVGNMTRAEVEQKLYSGGWTQRTDTPLVISSFGDISFEINPVDAGAVLTVSDAVNKTMEYGRSGGKLSQLINYVQALLKPADLNDANTAFNSDYINARIQEAQRMLGDYVGKEPYTVDMKAATLTAVKGAGNLELEPVGLYSEITRALKAGETALSYTVISREPQMPDFQAIHDSVFATAVDAKYSDDGRYEVEDETVGCDFDVSQAISIWNETPIAETAVVPLNVTWPSVTGQELRDRLYNDLLGTCTTLYTLSSDDRINNVNLCASKINEMILYPGDIFSYNNTVGERTEEAGFRYAAAYSDGEVIEELGGGACQVSSTTYCATLYARLETIERTCHQFEVAYFDQLGLDATVSWPEPDFKFRNNKTYPIKIITKCDNEARSLTVEIWGTAEDNYSVELKTDKYQYTNADGAWIGWRTLTYRILRDEDGNIVQVPDKDGNMVDYEYTNQIIEETGRPGMDTYMFH